MKKSIFALCLLLQVIFLYGQETLQSVTNRGATTSNPILISADRPLEFTGRGMGVYNRTVIGSNIANWGFHVDMARSNDSPTSPASDFGIAVRGSGPLFMISGQSGFVGIGTVSPDAMLTVAGNIHSREIKVAVNAGADFVFKDDYTLQSLEEIEDFVKKNSHLPNIASADQMKSDGINLGDMNIKLLQKVEELTLYLIEQNKKVLKQASQIRRLTEEVMEIKNAKDKSLTIGTKK